MTKKKVRDTKSGYQNSRQQQWKPKPVLLSLHHLHVYLLLTTQFMILLLLFLVMVLLRGLDNIETLIHVAIHVLLKSGHVIMRCWDCMSVG